MNSKNFIEQEELVEKIFEEYMSKEGYRVRIHDEDDLKYFGYGGQAVKEDRYAVVFNLHGYVYPRGFSISADDRNGSLVIMGETVAIYSISPTPETSKEEIANKFRTMLDDIYNKYKIYTKENRLDFVYNEYEIERKNYDKLIEPKINLYELIDNFCENCTDKEWDELLKQYCISDNENYMGEVRKNIEEAITIDYNSSSIEEKKKIINQLNRYVNQKKIKEQDIDLEIEK